MNPNLISARRFAAGFLRTSALVFAFGMVVSPLAAQSASATNVPPAAIVDKPLLPPTNDVPNAQPSPQDVWIPGHWRWGQGSYVWVAGQWEVPPAPNASWVAPQWQPAGTGYVLHDGYWQQSVTMAAAPATPLQPPVAQPAPQTIVVAPAPAPVPVPSVIIVSQPPPPPPAQVEVRYGRHSRYDVWVPGYWAWAGGRYVWITGHWARPPHGHRYWEEPRWERRGGTWVFIEGHWH